MEFRWSPDITSRKYVIYAKAINGPIDGRNDEYASDCTLPVLLAELASKSQNEILQRACKKLADIGARCNTIADEVFFNTSSQFD